MRIRGSGPPCSVAMFEGPPDGPRGSSAGQPGPDRRAHRAHVRAALHRGLSRPMTRPMSFIVAAAASSTAAAIIASISAGSSARGMYVLDDRDLFSFGRRQIVSTRAFVLVRRLTALLEHLLEHGDDGGVVKGRGAPVDFALLDRRGHHPQGREPRLLPGAHRILHVFEDAGFQGAGHGMRQRREGRSVQAGAADLLALQFLHVALHRGGGLALANRRGLFVVFATAHLGQHAGPSRRRA